MPCRFSTPHHPIHWPRPHAPLSGSHASGSSLGALEILGVLVLIVELAPHPPEGVYRQDFCRYLIQGFLQPLDKASLPSSVVFTNIPMENLAAEIMCTTGRPN